MRRYLGIRFRAKLAPGLYKGFAKFRVVFDNAVMDNGDTICRDVGVGVCNGGLSVGSPPRVRNTGAALNWRRLLRVLQRSIR